jgi:putative transposase
MNENSNIVPLRQPDEINDPLTNILQSGARQLLAQAVEMEAEALLAAMNGLKLPDGRARLVRHGHGPERTIQTGIGPVEVERVKIRDRGVAADGERVRFTSAILPLWARRTRSLDAHPESGIRKAPGPRSTWTICAQTQKVGSSIPPLEK